MMNPHDEHQRFLAAQEGEPVPAPNDRRRPRYIPVHEPAGYLTPEDEQLYREEQADYDDGPGEEEA
jgi:hypothetical protein